MEAPVSGSLGRRYRLEICEVVHDTYVTYSSGETTTCTGSYTIPWSTNAAPETYRFAARILDGSTGEFISHHRSTSTSSAASGTSIS